MEKLKLKYKDLGIDSQDKKIVYLKYNSNIRKKAGFDALKNVKISFGNKNIIATIHLIKNGIIDNLLGEDEIGLSTFAKKKLDVNDGGILKLEFAKMPLNSLTAIRSKMFGKRFTDKDISQIIYDINEGLLSDIHLSAFITECAANKLDVYEIRALTKAMVEVGERLEWKNDIVIDKHCIGGIPGNRTTPISISIVAAAGLTIPKTSSRAITSPAGTADTLEVLTNVDLSLDDMTVVVEKEGACLSWGGSMKLSPADDILIKIERILNVDSNGQMIASVLSKKIAAGSTHVVIEIPVGTTAKITTMEEAEKLQSEFEFVGSTLGLKVKVIISDGRRPIGVGIGPALEARDILKVLENKTDAPKDLKNKSIKLAAELFKLAEGLSDKEANEKAEKILKSGEAYQKFKAICLAQGAFKKIPISNYTYEFKPERHGKLIGINNAKLSNLAKIAGAPDNHVAGLELLKNEGDIIMTGDVAIIIHSANEKLLKLAIEFLFANRDMLKIAEF